MDDTQGLEIMNQTIKTKIERLVQLSMIILKFMEIIKEETQNGMFSIYV